MRFALCYYFAFRLKKTPQPLLFQIKRRGRKRLRLCRGAEIDVHRRIALGRHLAAGGGQRVSAHLDAYKIALTLAPGVEHYITEWPICATCRAVFRNSDIFRGRKRITNSLALRLYTGVQHKVYFRAVHLGKLFCHARGALRTAAEYHRREAALRDGQRRVHTAAHRGAHKALGQYFAALTNMRSVGVMGDERTYDYAVALRAVATTDFMTAEAAPLPWDVLAKAASRIVNEVPHVNRVLYDCTGKPPATVEFE